MWREPGPVPLRPVVVTPPRPRVRLALVLLALTTFSTTTLGGVLYLSMRTDETTALFPVLVPETITEVWSDPSLLRLGLMFSLPLLLILLSHEMGHYLACRRYRVPATLPYFLPAPGLIGTFGAFIRIRGTLRDRNQLFDVGIAGPIAGFVALLPFLVIGMAQSQPGVVLEATSLETADAQLYRPGASLALLAMTHWFHGGTDFATLDLHPFAVAAWVGMLVTALNLIPMSQLDGGHVLYAVSPRWHRRLAPLIWLTLLILGFTFWYGWLVWSFIVVLMGLRHPPLLAPATRLSRGRRHLAWVGLALLVLCFVPVPLDVVLVVESRGLLVELLR